jgi:hypothetical protein
MVVLEGCVPPSGAFRPATAIHPHDVGRCGR